MITDLVVSAVTDFLKASGRPEFASLTFFERDGGTDLTYPACIIGEDGSPDENEIIRGQWTVPIQVVVMTIPEDDESADAHRDICKAVNDLIGDGAAVVQFLSNSMQCNDSTGGQGATDAEDGFRQTTFAVEIKAAEISAPPASAPVPAGFTNTYSVLFDGVDDYMDCGTGLGDALGDNYAGSLTVSLWFKADVTSGNDGLFNIGTFANSYGPISIHTISDALRFRLNGSIWKRYFSFTDTASWHHLVCVYATGSEANSKIYLDGVVQAGSTVGAFPEPADMDFAGLPTTIGGYYSSSYTFAGKIDEPAIWTSALSAADIGSIWNSGTPTDLTSLSPTSWWRMGDSGTGSSAVLDVAGDNNGSLFNNPSYELDVPAA